ncbi:MULTISPECIES: ABC transporter permease [unclassified Shewanella]|uniref:ABC transporter permease n=1 Tax=unclassified Shewanella TaxID=196818 RepID=UPI000C820C59|nr:MULTISPECIES: ABC transporter permease [unclassified Shewanella]MDO6618944.1 ABC transporter permease [Shewanella sp. 6_MG-2023]PMI00005.1 ABC transporter ATP-binding protein [Shewanella sp. 10N.286.48.A6]
MFLYYCDLAWRSIKKTPMLSLLMILAISIGIGITITTLNVYKTMSYNPAGERSEQINSVQLWSQGLDSWDDFQSNLTYTDVINLRNNNELAIKAASFRTGLAMQSEDPEIQPVLKGVRVTDSDFFTIFEVPFLYGDRWDKSVDAQPTYQVVIGEKLNQSFFDGVNSVGKTIYLNRKPYQIVGVIKDWNPQPKYYDPTNEPFSDAEEIYIPFSITPLEEFDVWGNTSGWKFEPMVTYQDRLNSEKTWIHFWALLKTDAEKQQYKSWLSQYVEQQRSFGRFTDTAKTPAEAVQISDIEKWLVDSEVVPRDNKILVGLSVLFLTVCLVNILGLLLTKFLKRAPEVGVRRAIGASRRQIFSQYMVEVGIIGFIGGVVGLLWAWGALTLLESQFNVDASVAGLDSTMWIITPLIAISTAVLAGVYPAWVVCRTKPSVYLKAQ